MIKMPLGYELREQEYAQVITTNNLALSLLLHINENQGESFPIVTFVYHPNLESFSNHC